MYNNNYQLKQRIEMITTKQLIGGVAIYYNGKRIDWIPDWQFNQ